MSPRAAEADKTERQRKRPSSQLGGESVVGRRARVVKTGVVGVVVSHQANGWISVRPDGGGDHVAARGTDGLEILRDEGAATQAGTAGAEAVAAREDGAGKGAPRAPPLKDRVAAAPPNDSIIGRHVRLRKSGVVGTVSSERHGWIYVNPDKGGLPVQGHGRASMEFLDE